jgi:hypothetical protein
VTATKNGHQHPEAFALMTYASRDGRIKEVIWNSRDGVTPFCVTALDGETELTHVNWQGDIYAPDWVPPLGSRMFVDLTPERAKQAALKNARAFWDHPEYPASKQYESIEVFAELLAKEYLTPGAPDLVVVSG